MMILSFVPIIFFACEEESDKPQSAPTDTSVDWTYPEPATEEPETEEPETEEPETEEPETEEPETEEPESEETGDPDPDAIAIAGEYMDGYGGLHTVSSTSWTQDYSGAVSVFSIDSYDNETFFAIAQNDANNAFNAELWSRFDWLMDSSDQLWYCQTVSDAADMQTAMDTTAADSADPENAGCGGFAWTHLSSTSSDDDGDGYTEADGDCNDADSSINPGATDIVGDGIDQDCDGSDAVDPLDSDDDGDGESENQGDCDDTDSSVFTGAAETCDGVDNNCSGNEEDATDLSTFYMDNDGDGYGDLSSTTQSCSAPTNYVSDNTDCNDADSGINPGATDVVGDGIDQDCDGSDAVSSYSFTSDVSAFMSDYGCTSCHGWASNYSQVLSRVDTNNPASSSLYLKVDTDPNNQSGDTMPKGSNPTVTAGDAQMILDWITAGAQQ
jgi:hypothetical protein